MTNSLKQIRSPAYTAEFSLVVGKDMLKTVIIKDLNYYKTT
jgi:hypothetical protein